MSVMEALKAKHKDMAIEIADKIIGWLDTAHNVPNYIKGYINDYKITKNEIKKIDEGGCEMTDKEICRELSLVLSKMAEAVRHLAAKNGTEHMARYAMVDATINLAELAKKLALERY